MSTKDQVKYTQKFLGDTDYHKALGPQKIPKTDPYRQYLAYYLGWKDYKNSKDKCM